MTFWGFILSIFIAIAIMIISIIIATYLFMKVEDLYDHIRFKLSNRKK